MPKNHWVHWPWLSVNFFLAYSLPDWVGLFSLAGALDRFRFAVHVLGPILVLLASGSDPASLGSGGTDLETNALTWYGALQPRSELLAGWVRACWCPSRQGA